MYSYEWDVTTGGLLLNTSPLSFSKEPRPVYYKELDILGFDKYWEYDKNDTYPYMWAESNNYWYRGVKVAQAKGGSLYTAPELVILQEPEPLGGRLRFVDIAAMVEKNKIIMESLAQETIRKIYNTYVNYKDKVDVFYVAFSGGKDSVAMLDLVQRALPHNEFKVLFGDTGMEFPDTYDVVDYIEKDCILKEIDFLKAKSHLDVSQSWHVFGPPAQRLRWCCSVHKTTPQIIALRKSLEKKDFTGMAFIGVRADESVTRKDYDYISIGKKHKGQYSCNPILEWNSAELFLYLFYKNLFLNETYKKGNSRAGCLICPNSSGRSEYMKRASYKTEVDKYIDIIKETSNRKFDSISQEIEFFEKSGWQARNNGRDLKLCDNKYDEIDTTTILIFNKNNEWKEWAKTIGDIETDDNLSFRIRFMDKYYYFSILDNNNKTEFKLSVKAETKNDIRFFSLFRSVLKKASNCIHCKECEANCPYGCIQMSDGLKISNCRHCLKCHDIDSGCLVYNSTKVLKGVQRKMSIDSYASFGVEKNWVTLYLEQQEDFWQSDKNILGSMKVTALKRFLRDALLKFEKDNENDIANKMCKIYRKNDCEIIFWALILCNLAYAPQINWFIKNTEHSVKYFSEEIFEKLSEFENITKGSKNNIISSLKNIFNKTPIGTAIHLGVCEMNKNKLISITRGYWENPEPLVILYSLYKFAEACGEYYQFTLSRLLDYSIDSDGVSPSEIFGISEEQMKKILNGLSVNFPEFISVSFTLDLDNINLRAEKTSQDVLELF